MPDLYFGGFGETALPVGTDRRAVRRFHLIGIEMVLLPRSKNRVEEWFQLGFGLFFGGLEGRKGSRV